MTTAANRFDQLDDLVLHLKGLVLVRDLRGRSGAGDEELGMFSAAIDRTRDQLAEFVRHGGRLAEAPHDA
jgi:hypothetical protein